MNKNRSIFIRFLAVLILVTLACEGSVATSVPPVIVPTEPPPPTNTPIEKPTRCIPASIAQINVIQSGIKDIQNSNNIQTAWAVKSNDYENVWFIAAQIVGPGIEPGQVIGLWATSGNPDNPGMILSANPFAVEFSSYPDGSRTDAQISQFDDGAQEALLCASAPNP